MTTIDELMNREAELVEEYERRRALVPTNPTTTIPHGMGDTVRAIKRDPLWEQVVSDYRTASNGSRRGPSIVRTDAAIEREKRECAYWLNVVWAEICGEEIL